MTRGPCPYHRPLRVGDPVPSRLAHSPGCAAGSRRGSTPPCGPRGAVNSSAVLPCVPRTAHRVALYAVRSPAAWGARPSPGSGWRYWGALPARGGGVERVGLALVGAGPSADGAAQMAPGRPYRDRRQLATHCRRSSGPPALRPFGWPRPLPLCALPLPRGTNGGGGGAVNALEIAEKTSHRVGLQVPHLLRGVGDHRHRRHRRQEGVTQLSPGPSSAEALHPYRVPPPPLPAEVSTKFREGGHPGQRALYTAAPGRRAG